MALTASVGSISEASNEKHESREAVVGEVPRSSSGYAEGSERVGEIGTKSLPVGAMVFPTTSNHIRIVSRLFQNNG